MLYEEAAAFMKAVHSGFQVARPSPGRVFLVDDNGDECVCALGAAALALGLDKDLATGYTSEVRLGLTEKFPSLGGAPGDDFLGGVQWGFDGLENSNPDNADFTAGYLVGAKLRRENQHRFPPEV